MPLAFFPMQSGNGYISEEILGISPNLNAMTFAPLEYDQGCGPYGFSYSVCGIGCFVKALASSFALPGDVYAGNRQAER
jgi:hypothetical protein